MPLNNPFKFQKLKINVYGIVDTSVCPRIPSRSCSIPCRLSLRYENKFAKFQGLNTSSRRALYSHSPSPDLSLDIVLDGTGVTDFGIATLIGKGAKSVADQISSS